MVRADIGYACMMCVHACVLAGVQVIDGDSAAYSLLSERTYFSEYKWLVDWLGLASTFTSLAQRTLFVPNNYAMAQV